MGGEETREFPVSPRWQGPGGGEKAWLAGVDFFALVELQVTVSAEVGVVSGNGGCQFLQGSAVKTVDRTTATMRAGDGGILLVVGFIAKGTALRPMGAVVRGI